MTDTYIKDLDKALLEVSITIAYFGAKIGLTLEEVKEKVFLCEHPVEALVEMGDSDHRVTACSACEVIL